MIFALLLTACDKQKEHEPKEVVKVEPPFPSLSIYEILALNKNERAELERRCLGVQHQTCTNFKSEEFVKLDDQSKKLCESFRRLERATEKYSQAYAQFSGSYRPVEEEKNIKGCESYY